jgi:hypothetical protein
VGKYSKYTMMTTHRSYQGNERKSGLEAEMVRALGSLRSLRAKKRLAAEKRQETLFLSNEEKEKWTKAMLRERPLWQKASSRRRDSDDARPERYVYGGKC